MGLFVCAKCHCVENTALGHYWSIHYVKLKLPDDMKEFESDKPLCSECMPVDASFSDGSSKGKLGTGKWHNKFPKVHIDDFMKSDEGKYYTRIGEYGLQYKNVKL